MKQKAPVEKNQVYEMTITGQGSEGQGIGRVDGFAVFVPDALPGEVADVKTVCLWKNRNAENHIPRPNGAKMSSGPPLWRLRLAAHDL